MRKFFILLSLTLFAINSIFAQVGINTDGSQPHTSAMLDVKSNTKGLLPPRMTHTELDGITNAADGLIVYCTDCGPATTGAFFLRISGTWASLLTCIPANAPISGTHIPSANQITWNWNVVPEAIGYKMEQCKQLFFCH